ncbi:MAG: hypothetical protein LBV31_04115 [Prevotellaceae bacterium]|jgi:predicted glycosyltransferase|nr:hypothetical protein [Prevotellaceae bacterium]
MKTLVCPLNWGLGHATRCVPIIKHLIDSGNEVVVVADGFPLEFLKNEFPQLKFEVLPSYKVSYSAQKSQIGAMMRSLPKIIVGIFNEHRWLRNYLKNNEIDKVISDNRFGLWNKSVHSIYITHQLMVKMSPNLQFLEKAVWRLHRWFITHYDECWIPDSADPIQNLSGDLSHKYRLPSNAKFVGILSRFQLLKDIVPNNSYTTVCVISGIEPQRSIFEDELINTYENYSEKTLIVQGQPQAEIRSKQIGNIRLVSHLNAKDLAACLVGTQQIICRSGYSSIMDLATLNCLHKAVFVATSGQTEQEYLEILMKEKAKIFSYPTSISAFTFLINPFSTSPGPTS